MIINKNALSSVESRLLGDKFHCQLLFRNKTSVIFHNVNIQNVKIARRDKKTFYIMIFSSEENSFRVFTLKKLKIWGVGGGERWRSSRP